MRANNYSLTFKINQRKTPDRYLKPIALFVDPTFQSGAPYVGSGEVAYTPFRKRAVVPSSCLMYKVKDEGEIDIVNIKGLPYDFVRLILHGDYDYKVGDNLSYLIDMRLYNDRLRAFTQSNIQSVTTTDQPKCENVYYLLDHAARFIKNQIVDENGVIIKDVNEEIRRYRVVFLYDNVDDYNSYLFIRQLILGVTALDNPVKWAILALRKAQSSDIWDPFSNILHFTTNASIPPNYTDVFLSVNLGNQTVSEHVFLSLVDKVFLYYKIQDGLTTFTNNSLGKLADNLNFPASNNITFNEHFLNSIILYLDYNTINDNNNNNNDNNNSNLRIVGFGFIIQDAGDNIEDRISAIEALKGRESITNTDGILYEHTTLTAFLRFIVLYKYLGYDILCYATYNENNKEFKNIKTIDYVQKSQIYYDSNNISEAKKKIEQKEEDGFIIFKRRIQGNDKIFISYNDDNQNSIELEFDTIYQLESIISSLSNNRIRLVYASNSIKDIMEKYFKTDTNDKIVFTLNRYPTYRHDPMYVTNNSGSLGNPNYIEFLSDYYPLYWYYDGNNRIPDIGTLSDVSVADKYFYNLHPCVLIYGNSVRYPDTKRRVRVRLVKHLIDPTPGNNPLEYHYSSVTYMEIQDPVQLDSAIWGRLLSTQTEAKLPLDLDLITHTSNEVAPPVINLDYMTTPIRNFINANLISSRDILEYPMIPNVANNTPSEIDTNLKVYYREVLYWKYLRYLVNAGIVRYYFYNMRAWAAPDIIGYSVRRLNSDNGMPTTEITLSVPFYDNRVIDAIEIEINIVS
jgi:hypothetical protein